MVKWDPLLTYYKSVAAKCFLGILKDGKQSKILHLITNKDTKINEDNMRNIN